MKRDTAPTVRPLARIEPMTHPDGQILNGTAVAIDDRGLLIVGAAGSGKSGLAIELIGLGAMLVADDMVLVDRGASGLTLRPPSQIRGQIEARNIGILAAPVTTGILGLVVDLDQIETTRLPPERKIQVCDQEFPLLHKVESPHFAPAILQYLRHGRIA